MASGHLHWLATMRVHLLASDHLAISKEDRDIVRVPVRAGDIESAVFVEITGHDTKWRGDDRGVFSIAVTTTLVVEEHGDAGFTAATRVGSMDVRAYDVEPTVAVNVSDGDALWLITNREVGPIKRAVSIPEQDGDASRWHRWRLRDPGHRRGSDRHLASSAARSDRRTKRDAKVPSPLPGRMLTVLLL